jgi:hypothetical protein
LSKSTALTITPCILFSVVASTAYSASCPPPCPPKLADQTQ